jgi:acetyltransferase
MVQSPRAIFSRHMTSPQHTCTLNVGTPILLRPLRGDDARRLETGFRQLSPESRYGRFLTYRISLSPSELKYFTHCDGENHLALGAFLTDAKGGEPELVAIGRYVRDTDEFALAEVAIVVADAWQQHGIGKLLFAALAEGAWQGGVRHWKAVFLVDNTAIRRLLETVGKKTAECALGCGVVEAAYRLFPPGQLGQPEEEA